MMHYRHGGAYEILRASISITDILDGAEIGEKTYCVAHEDEDPPDMHVYEDHVYCFVCEFHGDVTKVWKEMHGFQSMWEAAQDLAAKFNVELPQMSRESQARYEERRRKEDEHARVAAERHAALKEDNPRARMVQEYLYGRGITDEIRDRFMLGMTPVGDLNIPFWVGTQVHGQVIRRLEGREPKYMAPKAEYFPLGRRPILIVGNPQPHPYLLVEGYLDQPAAEVLGIPAIGTGAAILSKEQIQDLRALGEQGATFSVMPDGDKSGESAARKNTRRLYPYGYMLPPIPLDGVKDVSDLYARDPDNAAKILRGLMEEGKDALELALSELPDGGRPKVKFIKDSIAPLLRLLPSEAERRAVIKDVAKQAGLSQEVVARAVAEAQPTQPPAEDPVEDDLPRDEWAHLLEPGVLDRLVEDACRVKGVVGEKPREMVKLAVKVALEAQLDLLPNGRPLGGSLMLTGPAGIGKNYVVDAAVALLPEEWYEAFEAASATVFYYLIESNPEYLKHKFIYPNEAEAVDAVTEFLRPMLSQGRAKKLTVNKNGDGQNVAQELHVEGPITGVIPTTRNKLNDELQSRMLVAELEAYEGRIQQHTSALSRQLSPNRKTVAADQKLPLQWRSALRSLKEVRAVVADFGDRPEFALTDEELEHGARLWQNLLALMAVHAWLEQNNREIRELDDGTRAVVATAEDYGAAYKLLDLVGRRSIVNLGETHRRIVQAVYDLRQDATFKSDGFSMRQIAEKASEDGPRMSKGTVAKAKTFLTKSVGLLYETEEGHINISEAAEPSWWEVGEVMKGFPHPDQVEEWHTPPPSDGNGGNAETEGEKADTYTEKPVSEDGNGVETHGNGYRPAETPLSGLLNPGESATFEELKRIQQLVDEGTSVTWAKAEVLRGHSPNGTATVQHFEESPEDDYATGSVVYAGKGGPGYDVYIGDRVARGGHDLPQSPWYNPFMLDKPGVKRDGTREEVNAKYIEYLFGPVENYKGEVFNGHHLVERLMETDGGELDGKVLGCWCAGKDGALEVLTADDPHPAHCHGQVLLQAVRNIKQAAASPNGKVEHTSPEPLLDDEEEL